MIQQKVEIRFEKGEAIRFISHHDLMRAIMRAVRRAGLPVRLTEGFNPRPRVVFPVALEVGVASLDEAAEIELTQCISTQDIYNRLSSTFPPALKLKAVTDLPPRRAGQIPLRIRYRLHLTEAGLQIPAGRVEQIREATSLPFERPREKETQSVDLRPALLALEIEASGDLRLDVQPSPKGSMRPLEVLSLLLNLPLSQLRQVRVTKLQMQLKPPPELSEEAQAERRMLALRPQP
ncbi:MAG TPA: TIGR03936 family radical SAM-associated protein [Planctomycetota bacterium]|jgi:radical SAM-linked protein